MILLGRPGAELLYEREEVGLARVRGDLAIAHAHDIDGLELNLTARRCHAQELSSVSPVIGLIRRHAVTVGKLPMDVGVKVGERGPEDFVELSRTLLIRRAPRLRWGVEKIVGEEFLEDLEIAPALHSLRVAAHAPLRALTQI